MKKNNKIYLVVFSILFTLVVFRLKFSEFESSMKIILDSSNHLSYKSGEIVGYLSKYVILGLIIYKLIEGIILLNKKRIVRNSIILVLGNLLLYAILFFLSPNLPSSAFFNSNAIIYFLGYSIFSLCASFINGGIFNQFRQKYKAEDKPKTIIWKYFLQSLVYTQFLYFVFINFVNPFLSKPIFYKGIANYVLVGVITIIFLGIFYFLEKKRNNLEKEIIKEAVKAESATAQFETLKNQLDPHFLFNSLNVLTGLIEENPDKAIDFTTSLSKIYRYVLEQKSKELIPVQEEINFAKTYISLLKLRFENSIDFQLETETFTDQEFIVPLSLQILLENVIKHNSASEQKPLKIRIYQEERNLVIENSLQRKDSFKDSTGVGLKNIINRYQLISNREVEINHNDALFIVKLPILTQKIIDMKTQFQQEEKEYFIAFERAKELKKYYTHLGIYIVFNLFFFILNYVTAKGHWWFYWPMLGWGLGIALHTVKVFGLGKGWEERKAQQILEKHNQQTKKWE